MEFKEFMDNYYRQHEIKDSAERIRYLKALNALADRYSAGEIGGPNDGKEEEGENK